MPYPLYLAAAFSRFSLRRATESGNDRDYRTARRTVAPKTRYKSRGPISFYRSVVIGELPRKPPGQCSSGYYVGSAITVSVSGFIFGLEPYWIQCVCVRDLLSPFATMLSNAGPTRFFKC